MKVKYKNIVGEIFDTEKETVICPCGEIISKLEIENDNVFWNGVNNKEAGEYWQEPWHIECAKKQEKWEKENGYRM